MEETEEKKDNLTIVHFMGFIHHYKTSEDFSDCGGLYTECSVYSKVPLEIKYDSIDNGSWTEHRGKFIIVQDKNGGYPADLPYGLQYHNDYNMLMQVIDKIESIGYQVDCMSRLLPSGTGKDHTCVIWDDAHENKICESNSVESKLDAWYKAVVRFCEWYNNK